MRVWHATRALSTLRVPSKRALSRSQDVVEELERVVPAAIAVFRAQNGHVVVPPSFRIPHEEDAWPTELHGARLGTMLMRLYTAIKNPEYRHLREQLVAMGLPPSAVDWREFHWRETTLAALTMYQRLHGDLYVPRSFVVPQDDAQWPRSTWGLALGRQVNTLRKKHTELPDFQRKALDQLDFPWNVMEHKWNTRFLPALRRFYALHGHSNVPQSFIVPTNDPEWLNLPQCHGYRLGAAVNKVRRGDAFTAQIETSLSELDAVNFTFQSSDQHWRERVLPALETFYRLHNHCDIHAYFIVPEDSSQWPKATHGMRLGFIVQNIRSRGDFFAQIMRDGEQLEAIEFVWNRSEMKWKQVVLPALETFAALHAHTKIPVSFVVPREAPWPPESYDLRLGRIASTPSARQRFANFIEIDRQRLASIGLDWTMFPRNEDEEQEGEDTDGDTEDDLDMLFEDEDEEEDW
ncbi:hypothetical protein Poli38472_013340 [Pythium oligandrum]|uniref:Helicase-associated domain-containing protein n=1 Tax=Pythium oligandrum TaxID=41045 RepID=A0A8K1C7J4_PYTOL|nr:hypothetical protein Poli38472_013340 [Pythium oligandrum]|eukprot:TMW57866.1 hypothetical protein Poli38472_013340 [Pythium oligandrum]